MTCPDCVFPQTKAEFDTGYVGTLRPTSLQLAAAAGKERCVRDLIAAEAYFSGDQGEALACAIENEHVQCAKLLIRAGADVNIKNSDESPMLLVAAYKEMHSLLKELLNAGADVNCQNCFTALHVVADMGYPKPMATLMEAGADVNAHIIGTGMILLKSGALVNQRCFHRLNALQYSLPQEDPLEGG